jgi:outer membrane lipoprotein-sorting protein
MSRRIVRVALLAALVASAAPLQAASALTPAELISRMEAAQRELRTLSAEFTQTSRVKLFKQEMSSTGRLLYERPQQGAARLRWEYQQPDPSTMVLIGNEARLRMGDEKSQRPPQVFDMAKDANLRAIFAQLRLWLGLGVSGSSLGAAEVAADYEMRTGGSADKPVLILAPRPTSVLGKTFSRVELSLDGRSFALLRLLLVEQSGDEKEIVFTRVKRNEPLPRLSGKDPFAL